jgi:hypothetical protein
LWCTDFDLTLSVKFTLLLAIHTIGREAVTVVRIVVVDIPCSIDITRIIRITHVRRTQPPVTSLQLLPQ